MYLQPRPFLPTPSALFSMLSILLLLLLLDGAVGLVLVPVPDGLVPVPVEGFVPVAVGLVLVAGGVNVEVG